MLEWLRHISEQTFLVSFIATIYLAIVLGRLWMYADGSRNHPMPDVDSLDAPMMAFLGGGWRRLMQAVLFRLWSNDMLRLATDGNQVMVERNRGRAFPRAPLERAVWEELSEASQARKLLSARQLRKRMEPEVDRLIEELESLRLIRTPAEHHVAWITSVAVFSLILLMGGARLIVSLDSGSPSFLLIVMLIVSPLLVYGAMRPWSNATRLGRRYLARVRHKSAWMEEYYRGVPLRDEPEPDLTLAIFGIDVLAGSPKYERFYQGFSGRRGVSETLEAGGSGSKAGGCEV